MNTATRLSTPAGLAGPSRPAGEAMRFGAFPITETRAFPPPSQDRCWVYITLNSEIALSLPRSEALQSLLRSSRARVSVDGQWIWWALRRKYAGRPLSKLSGSDLITVLGAHCAAEGQRLLLLGACPRANAGAVLGLRERFATLDVAGYAMPRFDDADEEQAAQARALEALRDYRPDYVVLGLGPAKQYRFAWRIAAQLDGLVSGVCCFGGAIDMASGQVRRAPRAWQQCGLEGLYRVLQQPSRIWRLLGVLRILPLLALGRY